MIACLLKFFLAFALCHAPFAIHAQTPPTGKSYSSNKIERPATTAPQFPSPVTFTDITLQTRINFKHEASPTAQKYLLETMGAGVALLDYDNDGRLDVFFTNGARLLDPTPKAVMPDKTNSKFWNRLYRQKADGTFEDTTEKAGVKGTGYGFGVAVGDYDRDGFADLFVTHYGGAVFYRNNGNGTFSDVTKKLGVVVDGWATSAGFFDYDRDGRLDLFVTRYVEWNFESGALICGDARPGYRAYCHPDNFKATTALLFHQKTDGTYENVSEKSGITQTKGKSLGVAFADFDDDGWTDVFIANDNSEQQLFRNLGSGGRFEDSALAAGVAYDDKGKYFSGMGIDAADYDGDGRQDVFITALSNETYPLYRNTGEMLFDYVTQSSGIGQITILGAGWGIKWIDADNDGRRDLFVAQSHVLDTIEKTNSLLKYKQAPLLIRNTERGFQNISMAAGDVFKTDFAARGMAAGDLDNDGDTDVIISQTNGAPVVLRNDGTKNHWLGIDLRGGVKSAPNGEGARVTVTDANGIKQSFDASNSGSYLAANDPRIIIGLGNATSVNQIEIRWTSGKIQTIENPAIDR
jgi:hypothetical protein